MIVWNTTKEREKIPEKPPHSLRFQKYAIIFYIPVYEQLILGGK